MGVKPAPFMLGRQADEDPLARADFTRCAVLPTFSQE